MCRVVIDPSQECLHIHFYTKYFRQKSKIQPRLEERRCIIIRMLIELAIDQLGLVPASALRVVVESLAVVGDFAEVGNDDRWECGIGWGRQVVHFEKLGIIGMDIL